MRIGIDFDNTIANYDVAFVSVALTAGLLPKDFTGGKREVREHVRKLNHGEKEWMRLQGQVYGKSMHEACLSEGINSFLQQCRDNNIAVFIISHKTKYGHYDENKVNLRDAATTWMDQNNFFSSNGFSIPKDQVYFENTREEKIARIDELNCDYFIDDLEEVLTANGFPETVKRYLYFPNDAPLPKGPFQTFKHWNEITDALFNRVDNETTPLENLPDTVSTIIKKECNELQPVYTGVNSRLYKLKCENDVFAIKQYYQRLTHDKQSRINREIKALTFMKENGIDCVPSPIGIQEETNIAVFEWIEGHAIDKPTTDDIDQVVAFVEQLRTLSKAHNAETLPLATEACLSGKELATQIRNRIKKLTESCKEDYPEVANFLTSELSESLKTLSESAQAGYKRLGRGFDNDIKKSECILSPSDFGFHNALKTNDGNLTFVDFEYFGWDDPIKLIADFLLHPGMDLTIELKKYYASAMSNVMSAEKDLPERLGLLFPLYGLRWCTIILNAFLPDYLTGNRAQMNNPKEFRTQQFEKSRNLFNSLNTLPQLILDDTSYYDAA